MQFKTACWCLFILLVLSPDRLQGQESGIKMFWKLSPSEKSWVIRHLFKAGKSLDISNEATRVTKEMEHEVGSDFQGGAADAFRHAYWMARLVKEIDADAAISLGIAHEKGNKWMHHKGRLEDGAVADSISSVMDMWNNCQGFLLAKEYPTLSPGELSMQVLNLLRRGELVVIRKNDDGEYLNDEGKLIGKEELQLWRNDKMLIPSK